MLLMVRFVFILAVAITITIMVTVTIVVVVSPRQAQGRGQVRCAEPAGDSGQRALHSPDGRDVISSQTRRATGGAHRERWRDGPRETAATGEAYRQASWQVPTPAEETPTDESKDLGDEAFLHRVSAKQERRGATLEPESQRTIRRPDPFTNLAEPRLAYERVYTLGVPVLAYKTFVEDGETLAEGLPERAMRKICLDNYPHDGIDICNGRCKYHGE
jgi:hypothetical protein